MEDKDIYKAPPEEHGQEPVRLFPKKLSYAAYITVGRRGINKQVKRKPLLELLVNTIRPGLRS